LFESLAIASHTDRAYPGPKLFCCNAPKSSAAIGSASHLPRYRDAVAERASVKATVPPPFADLARLRA